jgi:hypothetical protein
MGKSPFAIASSCEEFDHVVAQHLADAEVAFGATVPAMAEVEVPFAEAAFKKEAATTDSRHCGPVKRFGNSLTAAAEECEHSEGSEQRLV